MKRINPTSLIIELKYCIIATYTYFIKAYSLLLQEKESVEDRKYQNDTYCSIQAQRHRITKWDTNNFPVFLLIEKLFSLRRNKIFYA